MEKKGTFTEICKNYKISSEKITIHSKVENLEFATNRKVLIQGSDDGILYKDYQSKEINEQKDNKSVFYETDGHYSTVYLVCLMLGMDESKAEELVTATENPDTDVHSETDFEID